MKIEKTNFLKMKTTLVFIALLFGISNLAIADTVKKLPLNTTNGTKEKGVIASTVKYKGLDGIHVTVSPDHKSMEGGGCDNCTFLLADKAPFQNGTIQVKVAGKPTKGAPAWARGFVGIVFRVNDDATKYEGFYLRPLNALEDEPRRNFTYQYFSYPDYPWNRLRKEHPGKYEGYADVKPGEWIDMRIEVSGATAKFFVNDKQLFMTKNLFHGAKLSGGIGLFTEPATDAYFSDLKISYTK